MEVLLLGKGDVFFHIVSGISSVALISVEHQWSFFVEDLEGEINLE